MPWWFPFRRKFLRIFLPLLLARLERPRAPKAGVLVVRLAGIGDALLFRPALVRLPEALGCALADITLVGSTVWQPAAHLVFGDLTAQGLRILFCDENRFHRSLAYRIAFSRRIRRLNMRIAIAPVHYRSPMADDAIVAAACAAETIAAEPAPARRKRRWMQDYFLARCDRVIPAIPEPPRAPDRPRPHALERQRHFLASLAGRPIALELPDIARNLPALAPLAPGIVLHIGASRREKRWPLESFVRLAIALAGEGRAVTILGGPTEQAAKPAVAALLARAPAAARRRIAVVIAALDLAHLLDVIRNADAVVANDSAPGHFAALLGRPAVLLVGGGHFGLYMPYPEALRPPRVRFVRQPMGCYHCDLSCTKIEPGVAAFPCIGEIPLERVRAALDEVRAASEAPAA